MTHQFRPRKAQEGGGQGMRRGRGGRQREGLPKPDLQSDLESLPDIDYNHYDQMTPADLLKTAKAAKLSPNLLRHELIEADLHNLPWRWMESAAGELGLFRRSARTASERRG